MRDEDDFDNLESEESFVDKLLENKIALGLVVLGVVALLFGLYSSGMFGSDKSDVVVIESTEDESGVVFVEVSGAVGSPGVFEVEKGTRVDQVIAVAGGVTNDADSDWIEKILNRASVVSDGQKIHIPRQNKQSDVLSDNDDRGYQNISSGNYAENQTAIDINTASMEELESMWGIGQVTAQNIVDQRPYSTPDELLSRKIIKQNVYDRNKDKLTVY